MRPGSETGRCEFWRRLWYIWLIGLSRRRGSDATCSSSLGLAVNRDDLVVVLCKWKSIICGQSDGKLVVLMMLEISTKCALFAIICSVECLSAYSLTGRSARPSKPHSHLSKYPIDSRGTYSPFYSQPVAVCEFTDANVKHVMNTKNLIHYACGLMYFGNIPSTLNTKKMW